MREIKFRAWNITGQEMIIDQVIMDDFWFVREHPKSYTLMQYTGLKDKNGVEIYEGDIVRQLREDKRFRPLVGEVTVRNGFTWIEDKLDPQGFGGMQYDPSIVEVIGNIYEDKELLK